MPLTPLVHITVAFSNAVLVAMLPHVSNCAKQLDLPMVQPVTAEQVTWFHPSPYKGEIGGGMSLTNGYLFVFGNGYLSYFRSPDDVFCEQDPAANLPRYVGKSNMTTNEAIALARVSFRKLGYKTEDFKLEERPTTLEGPKDIKKLGHIPYCRIEWRGPEARSQAEFNQSHIIQFDIDMERKLVVGMSLISKKFFRPNPKVDTEPELETDCRKYQKPMFIRTNAFGYQASHKLTNVPVTVPVEK